MKTKKTNKVNGAIKTQEKVKPRTFNDILGIKEYKKCKEYSTDNYQEYSDWLKSQTLFELQSHAIRLELKPNHDRVGIERMLKSEFSKRVRGAVGAGGIDFDEKNKIPTIDSIIAKTRKQNTFDEPESLTFDKIVEQYNQ